MTREEMLQLTGFKPVGEGENGRGLLFGFPTEAVAQKNALVLLLYGDLPTGKQIKTINQLLKEDARLNKKVSVANTSTAAPGVTGAFIAATINVKGEDAAALYRDALPVLERALRQEGLNPPQQCPICEQPGGDTLVQHDGKLCIVHMNCLRSWKNERQEALEQKVQNGSHLRGILGGLLGGIVGAIPAFIALNLTEYFVGLLFVLIPLGVFHGWRLFGGKLDMVTTLFVIVYSLIVGLFVEIMDSWMILRDIFGPSVTLLDTIEAYLDPHLFREIFMRSTLMALGFSALGIFLAWGMIRKTDKHEIEDNQKAFDEAIALSQLTNDR